MNAMTDVIYGIKPVLSALESNPATVKEILISRKASDPLTSRLITEAKKNRVKFVNVTRKALSKRAGTDKHQGVVAFVENYNYADIEALLTEDEKRFPFIVALDEIQDPRNLGAIIRCVNVFGGRGIVLPKDRSVSVSPAVMKTSAGAASFTPVVRAGNLVSSLKKMKKHGFWIVGLDPAAPDTIYDLDLTVPLVVVIGNESKGMRRLVKEECDFLARIPMFGEINSLNASAATAVTLSEIVRQRTTGGRKI